jgi:hypothetical protein
MKPLMKSALAAAAIAALAGCGGQPDTPSPSTADQVIAVPPAPRPEPETTRTAQTLEPTDDQGVGRQVDPSTLPYSQRKRLREQAAQPRTIAAAAATYLPDVPLITNSGFEDWVSGVPVGFLASNCSQSTGGRKGSTALALNPATGDSKPGMLKFPISPPRESQGAMLTARVWARASAERLLTLDIAYFTADGQFHSKSSVHPGHNKWCVLDVAEQIPDNLKDGTMTIRVLRSADVEGEAIIDDLDAQIRSRVKSYSSTTFDMWTRDTPTGWVLTDATVTPARTSADRSEGVVLAHAADASKAAVMKHSLAADNLREGDVAVAAVRARATEPGLLCAQLACLSKRGKFKNQRVWHPGDGESHMLWVTLALDKDVNPRTLNLQVYRPGDKKGEVTVDSVETYISTHTAYVYSTEFDHWANGLPAGWSIKPDASTVAPGPGEYENSIALDLKRAENDADSTTATLHIQAGPEVIGGTLEAVARAKAEVSDVLGIQLAYFKKDGQFVRTQSMVPGTARWTSVPLSLEIPKDADPGRLSVMVFRKAGSDEGSSVGSVRARILLP